MQDIPVSNITKLIRNGKIQLSSKAKNILLIPLDNIEHSSLEAKYTILQTYLSAMIGNSPSDAKARDNDDKKQ